MYTPPIGPVLVVFAIVFIVIVIADFIAKSGEWAKNKEEKRKKHQDRLLGRQ